MTLRAGAEWIGGRVRGFHVESVPDASNVSSLPSWPDRLNWTTSAGRQSANPSVTGGSGAPGSGIGSRSFGAGRGGLGMAAWRWLQARRSTQSRPGRLRVRETVSLGEKRFVAVLEVDGRQFLVGGGATSVSLLAMLPPITDEPAGNASPAVVEQGGESFGKVLQQSLDDEGYVRGNVRGNVR